MKNFLYSILCAFLINSYVFSMNEEDNKIVFNTIQNIAEFYQTGEHKGDGQWAELDPIEDESALRNLNSNHYGDICNLFLVKGLFEKFCIFSNQGEFQAEIKCQKTVNFLCAYISNNEILHYSGKKNMINEALKNSLLKQAHDVSYAMYLRLSTKYDALDQHCKKLSKEKGTLVFEKNSLLITNVTLKLCTGLLFLTTVSLSLYIILCKAKT